MNEVRGSDGTSAGAARVVSAAGGWAGAETETGCGGSCFLERARRGAGFEGVAAVVAGAGDGDSPPIMAAGSTGCAVAGAEVERVSAGAEDAPPIMAADTT